MDMDELERRDLSAKNEELHGLNTIEGCGSHRIYATNTKGRLPTGADHFLPN